MTSVLGDRRSSRLIFSREFPLCCVGNRRGGYELDGIFFFVPRYTEQFCLSLLHSQLVLGVGLAFVLRNIRLFFHCLFSGCRLLPGGYIRMLLVQFELGLTKDSFGCFFHVLCLTTDKVIYVKAAEDFIDLYWKPFPTELQMFLYHPPPPAKQECDGARPKRARVKRSVWISLVFRSLNQWKRNASRSSRSCLRSPARATGWKRFLTNTLQIEFCKGGSVSRQSFRDGAFSCTRADAS